VNVTGGSKPQHGRWKGSGILAMLLGLLPLSCTPLVMESAVREFEQSGSPQSSPTCHTSLGAYFLPKSFVHVEVKRYIEGTKTSNVLENVETIVRADSRQVFCLDYLTNVAASDQIIVKKTVAGADGGGSQLLDTVASNAIDQSALIIRRAIRTAFTAMSGFRSFRAAATTKTENLANLVFDPFDQHKSAYINDRLTKTGFCLVLESYTYSGPLAAADAYCRNPLDFIHRHKAQFAELYEAYDTTPVTPNRPGIVYRPRVAFQLHIFMRDDPDSRGPWLLRKSMPVLLENISPVLSLALDRAVFTQKKMAFVFERGSLTKMCVFKGSEALAASTIPLEVIKSIVKLPTAIMHIQYDEITQSKELAKAQNNLLLAQQKYLALLNSSAATTDPASGQFQELPNTFSVKVDDDLVAPSTGTGSAGTLAQLTTFAQCDAPGAASPPTSAASPPSNAANSPSSAPK
jgi:hypothetical protein